MDIKTAVLLSITGIFATLGFSMLFRVEKKNLKWATLSGFLTSVIYVLCCMGFTHPFFQNLIPSLFATAFAEILARVTKSTATPYVACSVVVLIPGAKLYYTMYYVIVGQYDQFRENMLTLISVAAGIAVGIVLVSVVVREVNRHRYEVTNKSESKEE